MHTLDISPYIFVFLSLCLLVWLHRTYRLLVTQAKTPSLKPGIPRKQPLVSVLIPAKNEETNIRACVESLRKQTYPALQLTVVNDNSSDATEKILQQMGTHYINCPLPPEGWTGKTHALYHGARHVKGEWLLFTDADTRHTPESVASAIAYCETQGLDFLSLLPHCLTGSLIEELLQPSAMAYLGLWFPFEKVNNPASPLYFANGQYLLIKKLLYEKLGGHQAVAAEFLEDFALMRLAKKSGAKAQCIFGHQIYGTRMYDSFPSIWKGWRRIYLHAFERRPLPLLQNAAGIFFFSFCPFAVFAYLAITGFQSSWLFLISGGLLVWIVIAAWKAHRMVRTKGFFSLFHAFAALVLTGILLDAFLMAAKKQKTFWR